MQGPRVCARILKRQKNGADVPTNLLAAAQPVFPRYPTLVEVLLLGTRWDVLGPLIGSAPLNPFTCTLEMQ